MRIAVGGFIHETNTFAPNPTRLEDFGDWLGLGIPKGEDIFARTPKLVSLQGFAQKAQAAGHELLPLLHAAAAPANKVEKAAFEHIVGDLVDRLKSCGPLDAVFLDLHGAMVAEHVDDADAEVLRRVRAAVGPEVLLVASLDLHGNVTQDMIHIADGLVGYRTYPHVDMYQTGERCFELLEALAGENPPIERTFQSVPFLMPIHLQTTMNAPCDGLYAELVRLEAECGPSAKLTFMMGFSLSDVAQCRPCIFGYGPDRRKLEAAVHHLHRLVMQAEPHFRVQLLDEHQAVAAALEFSDGPTVMADVQDNAGGGATSDTNWIVRALVTADARNAVVGLMHDPESAALAHKAGVGAEIELELGGKGMPGHTPFKALFKVTALHAGPFDLHGPMMKDSSMDLGQMALLSYRGVDVVTTSIRTWYVEQAHFKILGADPKRYDIVVVKSTNHYRADFAPIAKRIIEFGAPGAVTLDPSKLEYRNLQPGTRLFGAGPEYQPLPGV